MKKSVELLAEQINRLGKNSHICAFYVSPEDRLDYLAAYYSVGIRRGEMCVFVSNQDTGELISELQERGLNIEPFVLKKLFHLYSHKKTYLPNGKFESSKMLGNLRDFTAEASRKRLSGIRGGGDMSWIEDKSDSWEEVAKYEAKINRFIRTANFTGICLFPDKLRDNSSITQRIVMSHQYMIRNGDLIQNTYYLPPEKEYKFDIKLVAEIEKWLDGKDSQETALAGA